MRRLITATMLAAALVGPAALSAQDAPPRPAPRVRAPEPPVNAIERILQQRQELGLSAEQVLQLQRLSGQMEERVRALREQMQSRMGDVPAPQRMRVRMRAQQEVRSGMRAPSAEVIEARRERVEAVRERMDTVRARALELTEEQRELMAERREVMAARQQEMREHLEEIRPLMEQMRETTRRTLEEARQVLTPEQQQRLRHLRAAPVPPPAP